MPRVARSIEARDGSLVVVLFNLSPGPLSLLPPTLLRLSPRFRGWNEVGIVEDGVILKVFHAVVIAPAGNCGPDLGFSLFQSQHTLADHLAVCHEVARLVILPTDVSET